jgi:hypothetical protein
MQAQKLKSWCKEHYVYSKSNITHVFLDKGAISISDAMASQFLECCAWNISNKLPISVVEYKTPVFKLFMDIDYTTSRILSNDEMIEFTRDIQKLIHTLLVLPEDVNSYCIVSVSAPKKMTDDLYKNGIHINWPEIYVSKLIARKLRDVIIQHKIRTRPDLNENWCDIFDESVYIGSGIRMMFSDKVVKCIECLGKKTRRFCENCLNEGCLYERKYIPLVVFDSVGATTTKDSIVKPEYSQEDIFHILDLTSIRITSVEVNCSIKEPLPSWYLHTTKFPESRKTNNLKRTNSSVKVLSDVAFDEEQLMKMGQSEERIDSFDDRFMVLEDYINRNWKQYNSLRITGLVKYRFKSKMYYHLRSNQHYCHNIKTEHRSNHVWFRVSFHEGTVEQWCFDTESCRKYKTSPVQSLKLSRELKVLLFPDEMKESEERLSASVYRPSPPLHK